MISIPDAYLGVLKRRDFFVLILTVFLGQIASASLVLSLITSVFIRTGSNFGVSGIILSVSFPALILMALAGVVSDILDRRKIIIFTNLLITLIVLATLFFIDKVYLVISLSFLYFAVNSFFYPAVSAATSQLVKKEQLGYANSVFFLTLAGGQIFGFFIAAIFQFFFGNKSLLFLTEAVLAGAFVLSLFLPKLYPRKQPEPSPILIVGDIWKFLNYIFKAKTIWFYFLILASCQAIIAFGITIAPGFFDQVVGLPITKSPLFIFPPVAIGIVLGVFFKPKFSEGFKTSLGFGVVGIATVVLGFIVSLNLVRNYILLFTTIYLTLGGIGLMILMIVSRTVLQKRVAHQFQGTIFGANFVVSSFLASIASLLAASLVSFFNYAVVLSFAGLSFLVISFVISLMRKRWRF